MKKLFLFFTLSLFFSACSQKQERGLILPDKIEDQFPAQLCCALSPKEGFAAYDQPNGKVIGRIAKFGDSKKDDQVLYQLYFITKNNKIQLSNLSGIDYDISALAYKEIKEGFVKIEIPDKNVWLKISEIQKQGFQTISWRDHLLSNRNTVLGYYADEPGLNLRKAPDANSEITGSVRGDLFEIFLTEEVSGQWCKVKVTKYREHPCVTNLSEEKNLESKSEGWLKIIDDNGEPNLWSYVKGC